MSDLQSNVIMHNILYCVDYLAITMFTMSRSKHCVYSFCTMISAFFSPINRTIKFSKPRLRNHNLLYKYNPAFSGLCKDIRVGHISKKTSEKSKIKFAKSERTGEHIGFVSRHSKTRQLKGVMEDSR